VQKFLLEFGKGGGTALFPGRAGAVNRDSGYISLESFLRKLPLTIRCVRAGFTQARVLSLMLPERTLPS
jgi:hypothetical protein